MVIGILAAQIINWIIAARLPFLDAIDVEAERAAWNVAYGWRLMFTAVTVQWILFFAGALFVPESPRWLQASGAREKAPRVLARIGGEAYAAAESEEIERTLARSGNEGSELKALLEPRVRAHRA